MDEYNKNNVMDAIEGAGDSEDVSATPPMRAEKDEQKKAAQKKERTDKVVNKVLTAVTALGNVGAKFEFSDDERARIFDCIKSAIQKAEIKFDRNDRFSL